VSWQWVTKELNAPCGVERLWSLNRDGAGIFGNRAVVYIDLAMAAKVIKQHAHNINLFPSNDKFVDEGSRLQPTSTQ
jgi:hypothetical protein